MSTSAGKLIWGCCGGGLEEGNYRNCTICEKAFHLACLTNYKEDLLGSKAWNCPSCSSKNPKKPRDDNTPIRSNANVTVRAAKNKQTHTLHSSPNSCNTLTTDDIRNVVQDVLQDQLSSMLLKINDSISVLMCEELRSVKQELNSAKDSVNAVKTQIEDIVTEHVEVKLAMENLKTQNSSMQRTITELSSRLHRLEQNFHSKPIDSSSSTGILTEPLSEPAPPCASSSEPNTDSAPAEMVTQIAPSTSQASDSQEWTRVTKKSKNRRPVSIQGAAGPSVTSLKAVEARKHLHLWNMESTADEIRDYLRTLCGTDACIIDELTPKGNYKSYKISVPIACYERCFSADVWPVNARIKAWINYRKQSSVQSNSQRAVAPQPFHEQLTQRDKAA